LALEKVKPIAGDIDKPHVGMDDEVRFRLQEELDLIISCAASITFSDPILKLIKTNYYGAFRNLSFAKTCKKENLVFTHVSTAFTHSYLPHGSTIPEEILATEDPD
jgi:thioester reductase-like protein